MRIVQALAVVGSLFAITACGAAGASETEGASSSELAAPIGPIIPISSLQFLYNPTFATPNTGVSLYSDAFAHGTCGESAWAGNTSAALDWPTTSNDTTDYGSIVTWLTNQSAPGAPAGSYSMLVAANTIEGGIAQQYLGSSPAQSLHQQFTVSVKVLSGNVFAGIGNSSQPISASIPANWAYVNALSNADAAGGPSWQTLTLCAPKGVGANEVLVYAGWDSPATYYVDNPSVVVNAAACP